MLYFPEKPFLVLRTPHYLKFGVAVITVPVSGYLSTGYLLYFRESVLGEYSTPLEAEEARREFEAEVTQC